MLVKGRLFIMLFDFIKETYGAEKLNTFMEVNPDCKSLTQCLAVDWYPLESYSIIINKTYMFFSKGDSSYFRFLGEFTAKHSYSSSHRLFCGISRDCLFASIRFMLSYYITPGSIVSSTTSRSAHVQINCPAPSDNLSKVFFAWMQAFISNYEDISIKSIPSDKSFSYYIEKA